MAENADIGRETPATLGGARTGCGGAHPFVEFGAPDEAPMTIGQVAREFGMTLRALRFYKSKRLVAPQRRGAVRLYRRTDRARIMLVLTARRLGFTLAEIGDLVGRSDGKGLQLTREKCVDQINLLERQKRGIEVALAELRDIYTAFYKTRLEEFDTRLT